VPQEYGFLQAKMSTSHTGENALKKERTE